MFEDKTKNQINYDEIKAMYIGSDNQGRSGGVSSGRPGGDRGCGCRRECEDRVVERPIRLLPASNYNRLIPNVDQAFLFRQGRCEEVVAVQYGNDSRNLDCDSVVFCGSLGTYTCTQRGIFVNPYDSQPLDKLDVIVCWICSNGCVRPCLAVFGYQCNS